jgi:hypothetical protein
VIQADGNAKCSCLDSKAPTSQKVKTLISLKDPRYFAACGWTMSYDPKAKAWISFHDWKPSLMMPSMNHFYTIKDNALWKHNDRWDSYANFYGVNYAWEVEYPVLSPGAITSIRNVEYTMEAGLFSNKGRDFKHLLDANFDRAIIYNSEQTSGLLKLTLKPKNNPAEMLTYPKVNLSDIEILYAKEENKYRFNQFWDVTKDRGEFNGNTVPMWVTACSGYQKILNPAYLNYGKPVTERKKFRHYGNSIILRKNISGALKMNLKLSSIKQLTSFR